MFWDKNGNIIMIYEHSNSYRNDENGTVNAPLISFMSNIDVFTIGHIFASKE